MNLTYTIPESKKDISVKQYLQISKLYKDAEETETEVNEKELIALCLKIPVALVDKLPFEHYNQAIKVISDALNRESTLHLTFGLNGIKYGFINDIENMTAGEYGALDELVKDTDKNAYKILNVLYRPLIKEKFYKSWFNRKKKRGRYLIQPFDASNDITVFENAPFEIYESALVFFYNLGKELVSATQNYMSQAEQKQAIEMQTLQGNGVGFKHLIHTLAQSELELKKSNIKLSTKYYLD
jgi:hypothetical protein